MRPVTHRRPRSLAKYVMFLLTVGLMGALTTFAFVGTAVADGPSDPRATFHEGNATTCAQVGFPGSEILGSGGQPQANGTVTSVDSSIVVTVSAHAGGGQELNVVLDPSSGLVIDTIIVKGGNAYNQYPGTVLDHLIAPFVGATNNVGDISHWFLCYHQGEVPPPPPPPPGEEVTPTPPAPGAPAAVAVTARPVFTG
jgi:hypothetical protein